MEAAGWTDDCYRKELVGKTNERHFSINSINNCKNERNKENILCTFHNYYIVF